MQYHCVSIHYIHTCGMIQRMVCLKLNIFRKYGTTDNSEYTKAGGTAIASSSVTISCRIIFESWYF